MYKIIKKIHETEYKFMERFLLDAMWEKNHIVVEYIINNYDINFEVHAIDVPRSFKFDYTSILEEAFCWGNEYIVNYIFERNLVGDVHKYGHDFHPIFYTGFNLKYFFEFLKRGVDLRQPKTLISEYDNIKNDLYGEILHEDYKEVYPLLFMCGLPIINEMFEEFSPMNACTESRSVLKDLKEIHFSGEKLNPVRTLKFLVLRCIHLNSLNTSHLPEPLLRFNDVKRELL